MSSSRALESAADDLRLAAPSSSLPWARIDSRIAAAPLLQLAQVAQPLLERAQLGVVERAGRLLAVAGDERHGGAAVEQLDRRPHLPLAHAELVGDPLMNRLGHDLDPPSIRSVLQERAAVLPPAGTLPGAARRRVGAPRAVRPRWRPVGDPVRAAAVRSVRCASVAIMEPLRIRAPGASSATAPGRPR